MKEKLLSICFSVVSILAFSQNESSVNPNGYNTFFYDNGVVASEGWLSKGKPDGYWKTYYKNGKLKSEGNRLNFELDSIWKFYTEDGKISSSIAYKQGKKNGIKRVYNTESGDLVRTETYLNGVLNGEWKEYYGNGLIMKIVPYVMGLEHGRGLEYGVDSTIITIVNYKNGHVKRKSEINRRDDEGRKQNKWVEFYPSGNVYKEMNYYNGVLNGVLKEFEDSGNLIQAVKYVNGKLQKPVVMEVSKMETQYYSNGKVKSVGSFQNKKPVGLHREYGEDGEVISATFYNDGKVVEEGVVDSLGDKQGKWKEYHLNGSLKSVGEYINDRKVGDWVYYFENSKVEQVGKYDKKGRAQGEWVWYYPCVFPCIGDTGSVKRVQHFLNNKLEGEIVEYDSEGVIITSGKYFDDKQEGDWVVKYLDYKEEGKYVAGEKEGMWKHYYHLTNTIRFEGQFVSGEPEGKHTYYYPNGRRKQTGTYAGGLRDGVWKFYDELDGLLFMTILYNNGEETKVDGLPFPND